MTDQGVETREPAKVGRSVPPGCFVATLFIFPLVAFLIVNRQVERPYDFGYQMNALASAVWVAFVWCILPLAAALLLTRPLRHGKPRAIGLGVCVAIFIGLSMFTVFSIRLAGPEDGMHGEDIAEGESITVAMANDLFGSVVDGGVSVSTPKRTRCMDGWFGRQRDAYKASVEVKAKSGNIDLDEIRKVEDRLRAEGWDVRVQVQSYENYPADVVYANRDGYQMDAGPVYPADARFSRKEDRQDPHPRVNITSACLRQ